MTKFLSVPVLVLGLTACAQQVEVVEVVNPTTGEVTYETRGD